MRNEHKQPTVRLRIVEEDGVPVLYLEIKEGRRFKAIAKRYQKKNWINLEPGYTVRGGEPGAHYDMIEVECNPEGARVQ
jgi:hypothetical protein